MTSKLEKKIERDELDSDYLAKKKRRKKREFSKYKTLLPMDSFALAFLSPTKHRSRTIDIKKKLRRCLCPTISSSIALTQSD